MHEIRSFSRFGLSVVTIVFDDNIDVYWARQQVAERLLQVQNEIPQGVGTISLGPVTTGLGEIYQYVVRPKEGYESKYKKLFKATWATLTDEEFLINYLKECLQIKNYVKRRIGRDPIFLNTTYLFWQYKEIVRNSQNQWLKMLWFDLLEFDKINDRWFNKGKFDLMTACGHVLPQVHSDYARDLAREHFGWGHSPT